MPAFLITQCLQNDFVQPIGKLDPLPNLLHVGYEEARRLMGENPAEGAVARVMQWAYQQESLGIIHIRDWHDPLDSEQQEHFEQFGSHCVANSVGAAFAFEAGAGAHVVDSISLNDFQGTALSELLAPLSQSGARVGLMGVWTEAKVSFLAYELRTRWPHCQVAVCSALTASSSRVQHFVALEQMQKLLGVHVFDSVSDFTKFLGKGAEMPLPRLSGNHPLIEFGDRPQIPDESLVRFLFRDCRSVCFRSLAGGYSGNLVLESQSVDLLGQQQVPHVVKIGPTADIGTERSAFERIESVLGNSAPRVADFADLQGRGAIKYRYAAMGRGQSSTLQARYMKGLPRARLRRFLSDVFEDQLGRLYAAATLEKTDLLEYYAFTKSYAPRVSCKVSDLLGAEESGPKLLLPGGRECFNPCRFYEQDLSARPQRSHYFSYVHGDLNGANIIIDSHDNVWLIDFFHAHRGHVLRDLLKLENDLLYIFTPLGSQAEWEEALELTDQLMRVRDASRLPPPHSFQHLQLKRAYDAVRMLRSFYGGLIREDKDPEQIWIGQLRYAIHTLSFYESNHWQKLWALYTAGRCAEALS